jgi:hypothetical protein
MRDGVVPKFEDTTMHRNDIVVATDDVARGDFVVPNLAEDTGGESRKTIGTGVVSRVGEAKDVEPTDPELSGAMFAIAEAGGFEGSDQGEIVRSVAGIHREVRVLDGAGTVITIQRWGSVTSGDGVTARSTCSLCRRPCHTRTFGRGEMYNLNIGWTAGGVETCVVVHIGRLERIRSVARNDFVRKGGDRGGGRSIRGWTTFDGGNASCKSVKVGPEPGNQRVGDMPEATAVTQEAAAIIDQFIVETCGCGRDEVGGSRNACVHVAEGAISRRDAFNCCPDVLIQGVDAWAERLECLEPVAQGIKAGSNDAISRRDTLIRCPDTLIQGVDAWAKRLK